MGMNIFLLQVMKHILFCLSLCAALLPCRAFSYDFSSDGVYYGIANAESDTVFVTFKDSSYVSYAGAVTVPDSVMFDGKVYRVAGVGDNAFRGCAALTSVHLPDGIAYIGDDAFRGCSALRKMVFPKNLETVGYNAFGGAGLDSLFLPSKVRILEPMAFMGNKNLKYAELPDSLKFIGDYAFMDCRSLKTLNIPEYIEIIGRSAFFNCYSWGEEAHIGIEIKRIGIYAFGNCFGIKRVYCAGEMYLPYCEERAFGDIVPVDKTLIVFPGMKKAYSRVPVWKDFKEIIEQE